MPAEILLDIGWRVTLLRIIKEEVGVRLVSTWTRKVEILETGTVSRDQRGILHAFPYLLEGCLRRECAGKRIPSLYCGPSQYLVREFHPRSALPRRRCHFVKWSPSTLGSSRRSAARLAHHWSKCTAVSDKPTPQ